MRMLFAMSHVSNLQVSCSEHSVLKIAKHMYSHTFVSDITRVEHSISLGTQVETRWTTSSVLSLVSNQSHTVTHNHN